MEQDEVRTVRDFVKDMCRRGRTDTDIKAVAFGTRWRTQLAEVYRLLAVCGRKWRELGPREDD